MQMSLKREQIPRLTPRNQMLFFSHATLWLNEIVVTYKDFNLAMVRKRWQESVPQTMGKLRFVPLRRVARHFPPAYVNETDGRREPGRFAFGKFIRVDNGSMEAKTPGLTPQISSSNAQGVPSWNLARKTGVDFMSLQSQCSVPRHLKDVPAKFITAFNNIAQRFEMPRATLGFVADLCLGRSLPRPTPWPAWIHTGVKSWNFLLPLFFIVLIGCQTVPEYEEIPNYDYDENNHARGAAYAAEHFTWHKSMRSRPKNSYEFYYKHCERLDESEAVHISKVEWWCSSAPF
jgi:hypothetical protein